MGRHVHKLTAVKVAAAKKPGYIADGGNLYLRVASGGSKSWMFRFTMAGRTRDAGLGSYPTISLSKAREEAEKYRRLVAGGADPIEVHWSERQAALIASAKAVTFEECARTFVASHEAGWRNGKHRAQWSSTLKTYVYPLAGSLPVQSIDTTIIISVLQPIWTSKPETAGRVRGRIEAVLNWAKVRGYRDGENPARWRGHLDQLLPAKSKVLRVVHHAALPYANVSAFVGGLREQITVATRALEFLILTATRTSETLNATWDEVNLEEQLWEIPAERMKSNRAHRIPLCRRTIQILNEMAGLRQSEFVFPGAKPGRPLSNMALAMWLRRMGYHDITVHGFRSTFRDWVAERTAFAGEVAEMALAHAVPDAVERAYRRSDLLDQRRKLMEAWAAFCGDSLSQDASTRKSQRATS